MSIKLIRGWKVELFEKPNPQSSILGALSQDHRPFFTGYSKDPVNMSGLQDGQFITVYRDLDGLAASSFRVCRIHHLECSPIHEPDNTFEEAAKPLIKWMAENVNPHSTAVVDSTSAVLYTAEQSFQTEGYLKD